MSARPHQRRHSARDLETILGVTSALAAPFDLMTMLAEVVSAAKQVLNADRGSVWLYDDAADELVLEVATGIRPEFVDRLEDHGITLPGGLFGGPGLWQR